MSTQPSASSSQAAATASVAIEAQKLDCTYSSRPVWLVKVPKYLATAFESATVEDVGQLSITKTSTKLEIKLKVNELILGDKDLPTTYDVPLVPFTSQKMAIMAQTGGNSGNFGFLKKKPKTDSID
jgi:TFIIF, beta subunit N-terminus